MLGGAREEATFASQTSRGESDSESPVDGRLGVPPGFTVDDIRSGDGNELRAQTSD